MSLAGTSLRGTRTGPCLVVGGGRHAWDDLAEAERHGASDWPLLCANDIGMYLRRPVDDWVSLHHDLLPHWLAIRRGFNFVNDRPRLHSIHGGDGIDVVWPGPETLSVSGLLAVKIALTLGHDRVVCCGVPCDGNGWFYAPHLTHWQHTCEAVEQDWLHGRDKLFAGRVTSLSGRTRDWLGAPAWEA